MANKENSSENINKWKQYAYTVSEQMGVPPAITNAVIETESSWRPGVRGARLPNGDYAIGLGQHTAISRQQYNLTPTTALIPEKNIEATVAHIADNLKRTNGDPIKAYALYHSGVDDLSKLGQKGRIAVNRFSNNLGQFIQSAQAQGIDPNTLSPIDPSQLQVPVPKSGWVDKFVQATGALANIGGTAANIIGAIKGTGAPGNTALAIAQQQQEAQAKQQEEVAKRTQLNTFLQNKNVPVEARLATGLEAQGTPQYAAQEALYPQPTAIDLQNIANKNISERQIANDKRDRAIRMATFTPAEEKSFQDSEVNRLNTEEILQRIESGVSPNILAALATNMDTGSAAYQRIVQKLNPKELETVQIIRDVEQRVQKAVKEASGVQYGFKELNWLRSIMPGKYDTPEMLKTAFKRAIVNSRFNQLIPVIGKIKKVAAYDPQEALLLMESRGVSSDMLRSFETITNKLNGLKSSDPSLQISVFSDPKYLPELRALGLNRILE